MSIRLTTPLTSKPYVLMTLWCQRQFGVHVSRDFDKFVVKGQKYSPARLEVEGDLTVEVLEIGAFNRELGERIKKYCPRIQYRSMILTQPIHTITPP
jgi:hypothetical protein